MIVSTAVAHTCPIYFQTHVAANPSPIISTMASKKRKVDSEGRRFQEKWELQYFFTDTRGNCVCLICQETVALFKEFNVKRQYQTKHANAFDKLTASDRAEKVKQLKAALASQQQFFTRANDSNENITKASYEVAMLNMANLLQRVRLSKTVS